jgi:hypothetical protein
MLLRRELLRAHAGLQRFRAPAAGAPHGFVVVDVDRIEIVDDIGGAFGGVQRGRLQRQHGVAAVKCFSVHMAVGVLPADQFAEHLLDWPRMEASSLMRAVPATLPESWIWMRWASYPLCTSSLRASVASARVSNTAVSVCVMMGSRERTIFRGSLINLHGASARLPMANSAAGL